MLLGKGHVGQDVFFRLVHQRCQLGQLAPDLISHLPPLRASGCGIILGKGGRDEGGDDAPAALAGVGEGGPGKMHPAALPRRLKHPGDGGLDAAMGVGNDQFDAAQATAFQLAAENSIQKVSASDGPMSMPSTSRRPSVFTATAMVTATETMRPFWRTFTEVASSHR